MVHFYLKKKAVKANYIIHGLAFRFSSLEQHEEEKIRQNGVDLTEVKTNIFLDYSIISIFCVVVTITLHLANFVSIYFSQCVMSNTLAFILFFFQCKTHYNSIISDLNKKCLFQNYPVFSSLKWRCILLCTVTTAFSLIWIASLFLSVNNSSYLRNKTYAILNFSLGLPFLVCICPCGLIIIYGCRKKVHIRLSLICVKGILMFCFFYTSF